MRESRIMLPEGHQWRPIRDTLTVTEFICHECQQTFVHYPATNTHTNPASIRPHGHNAHLVTETRREELAVLRIKGPRPRSGDHRRCDACDYLVTARRVRVWVTLDVPPSAGMLVCPACAAYFKEKGIATRMPRKVKPRGLRKAGAGEFARCSRFAD
jgi:hypothetical protein